MRILGKIIDVNKYRTEYFSVDPNKMIEMDRFVVKLDGSESQTLNIKSTDSHATMKDEGGSLEKYIENMLLIL